MKGIGLNIVKRASKLQNYHWLLIFLFASLGLRFFSFFPSVLGHDESTYMIIGRDILNGKKLYTDVFDTKPVGIFLFYEGLEFLFGSSIFLKRLVFALIVGVTSYFIFNVSKKLFKGNKVAVASAFIYIFYTSLWNYHGRSPNTELLFNLFTIVGLFFFLKPKPITFFLGGLSIGIGFMVKYLVLFDIFAFLLYFFVLEMKALKRGAFLNVFTRYLLASLGFLLPFATTNLYFWLGENFNDFYYITYELPRNYGSSPSIKRYTIMLLEFFGKFLPITFFVYYTVFRKNKNFSIPHKWFLAFWVICVLAAMYVPGKEMSHYTIQLMLPFSLIAGFFFHNDFHKDRITKKVFTGKSGFALLVLVILATQFLGIRDDFLKPDYPREVAEHIRKDLEETDQLYVSNYEQIIYYLLEIESPTKYIHSTLLFSPKHTYLPVDRKKEVKRIISNSPKFVLVEQKNEPVESLIKGKYRLDVTFRNGEILVYKRIH